MTKSVELHPAFKGAFEDKRIAKRASELLEILTDKRNSSINFISSDESERRSFYRLLSNTSFSETSLIENISNHCRTDSKNRDVVVIQDSSEFNLTAHTKRLKINSGLGKTNNDDVLGFLLHSSLAIDFETGIALGFSDIQVWDRGLLTTTRKERDYKHQPIQAKESNKWLKSVSNTEGVLEDSNSITIVCDRESDIYDLYFSHTRSNIDYVIRSNFDRRTESGKTIKTCLSEAETQHTYTIEILGDIRTGAIKRTAQLSLKWTTVKVMKPKSCLNKKLPGYISLTVVEAAELNKTDGIKWILLTTKEVTTVDQAMKIVQTYKFRWYIEQLHRLLKKEGFKIESSELESGYSIRKLTLIAMMAALKILQLMVANVSNEEQSIDYVFNDKEVECLQKVNYKKEGKTDSQKNPYKEKTIKWAYWIIARLGGWKANNKQRKAGPITLQKGLIRFYDIYEGWILNKT